MIGWPVPAGGRLLPRWQRIPSSYRTGRRQFFCHHCSRGHVLQFLFPSLLRHLVAPHFTPQAPHRSPLDTRRTPPSLISFSSNTPEHQIPTNLWIFPGSPQISSSSHGHPSLGPSLIPFPCVTFISTPLLLSHLVSPYLTSIFDSLYHC